MQWITRRNLVLPLVVSGIVFGVLVGTVSSAFIALLFFITLALATLALSFLTIHSRKALYIILSVFFFSSLLGTARVFIFDVSFTNELGAFEQGQSVVLGSVIASPEYTESSVRFRMKVTSVNDNEVDGVVLVSANPFTEIVYGDYVRVRGVLKKPESFITDSGRTFDYERYLYARHITHTVSFAQVSVEKHTGGNPVVSFLQKVKNTLVRRIETILPDPEAPLLSGLLLGERQSLGEELYTSFQKAGVVHMIVLSGYNVSLVAHAFLKTTSFFLPRVMSFSTAGIGIIAFALMTGASETTVRASIMATLIIVASVLKRPHSALRALLLAGAIMVLINPYILLFNLSFQLSFLATAGIILAADPVAKKLTFLPTFFGIRDIAGATIVAQASVLPLLIVSIGSVSIVSPIANVAVIGAVPWAMAFGFIASMLSFISPVIAFPVTVITEALLIYILKVSVWFGGLPFASLTIPQSFMWGALVVVALSYATLGYVLIRGNEKRLLLRSGS